MSTIDALMADLEARGNPQVRATYGRHGARGPMFGLRIADLEALARQHRHDHALAQALWATGNLDARLLAVKLGDPQQTSSAELDRWARDCDWYMSVDRFVADFAVHSRFAVDKATRWRGSKREYLGRAGWSLVAGLACNPAVDDEFFAACIDEIAAGIHAAPNRKREAMNAALIAIGGYRLRLRERALAVADAIGEVAIDHGDSNCKTPNARAYIEKMVAGRVRRASKKVPAPAPAKKTAASAKKTPRPQGSRLRTKNR